MKREYGLLFVFAFAMLLSLSFVSAQTNPQIAEPCKAIGANADWADQANYFVCQAYKVVKPTAETVLGKIDMSKVSAANKISLNESDLFVAKLLLFILVLAIVYYTTTKVPGLSGTRWVMWVVSIVVSLLFARLVLNPGLIMFAAFPSNVLGVALAALLPFILFFFFIESMSDSIIRKIGWIFFTVLFFGMAIVRWNDFAVGSTNPTSWNYGWIYVATGVISLLVFWFDRKVHGYFMASALSTLRAAGTTNQAQQIELRIDWANRVIGTANASGTPVYDVATLGGTVPSWWATPMTDMVRSRAKKWKSSQESALGDLLTS